jgi:pyruvate/2-oxoglutarate dehydrogenase complex dihydrolipoamide dehydrogenase (E3) component
MSMQSFEFVVVGGGKAGKTLAANMASSGRSVAMIEKGQIGGTCINIACIPTKTLVRSAKIAELAKHAANFGIRVAFQGVDIPSVRQRRDGVVSEMVRRNQALFDRSGMTLLIGTAAFIGPRTLEVTLPDGSTQQLTGEKVFINTGTRPIVPNVPGLVEVKPLTSDSIQRLDRLPEHLLILGGGYIGLEFAQMFRRFGSRVTVIERGERFLPREDADVGEEVLKIFHEEGIEVRLGTAVKRLEGLSGQSVRVVLESAQGETTLEGSDVLAAIGREPVTQALNLAATGVDVDARGFVKVNDRLETSAANIWALGDVTGGPQFTHVSLDDYRIVVANLNGGNRTTKGRVVPYTLFIDPELGRVGLSEEEARRQGLSIRVAKLPVSAIPRAVTLGETRGLLKAVIDANSEKILGVSILAPEGGEIMAVVQMAMAGGLPYTTLRDTIFAHPTMSEALNDLFAKVV